MLGINVVWQSNKRTKAPIHILSNIVSKDYENMKTVAEDSSSWLKRLS